MYSTDKFGDKSINIAVSGLKHSGTSSMQNMNKSIVGRNNMDGVQIGLS